MNSHDLTGTRPIAQEESPRGVNTKAQGSEHRERREESIGTEYESSLAGVIMDSWVESASAAAAGTRLVLQVAPRGHHEDLVIVELESSMVSDRFLLEDLSENLCHGSEVLALGSRSFNGYFMATQLQLTR